MSWEAESEGGPTGGRKPEARTWGGPERGCGERAVPGTQGSQCVWNCLGPRNRPPGAGGTAIPPACVGGAVQPSRAFQSARCGGWARRGPWRPGRGHCAQLLLRHRQVPLGPPGPEDWRGPAGSFPERPACACAFTARTLACARPGACASERPARSSPLFVLGVHRGQENPPRKSQRVCEPAGKALCTGGARREGTPFSAKGASAGQELRSPPGCPRWGNWGN